MPGKQAFPSKPNKPKPEPPKPSRVEELRKEILALSFDDIQQLKFNLPPRPPAINVVVKVVRDPNNPKGRILQIKQDADKITTNEQLAWTCPDGRLEIRFSRALNPFAGDAYEVARGGKVFSGKPVRRPAKPQAYKYSLLVTTPDGYFLTQDVTVTVVSVSAPK
jgi:hypothetical protein